MTKQPLQKAAGAQRVCPQCGSTDVKLDIDNVGGECKSCHKRSSAILQMSYIEVSHYRRRLAAEERMRKFSLLHCEEAQAFLFVLMFATLLVVFIVIAHSRWGLW